MSTTDGREDDGGCTTNAHDLQEVAKLQARLEQYNTTAGTTTTIDPRPATTAEVADDDGIPPVNIDEGAHKYVLVSALSPPPPPGVSTPNDRRRLFVRSKRHASYHCNVAEILLPDLKGKGYSDIRVLGGGRILRNDASHKVHIFGYSYGFGRADHEEAMRVVERSGDYGGYEITWSNEGY